MDIFCSFKKKVDIETLSQTMKNRGNRKNVLAASSKLAVS